jgi:hypothetical protein
MERCSKCWCPNDLGHNVGCPAHEDASPTANADYERGWKRGWKRGFSPFDNDLTDSEIARLPNKSYAFGYRSGKAEINSLADNEAQSRCFG